MSKVTIERVTSPEGITKDYFNPKTQETYPIEIPYGYFIVNHDSNSAFKWTQVSQDSLEVMYKPVGGQTMGEDGEYETK
jgi:hypothetical protein